MFDKKTMLIIGSFLVIFLSITVTKKILEQEEEFKVIQMEDRYGYPLVTISMKTYNEDSMGDKFGNHPKWDEFNNIYGDNYTNDLHNSTIEYLKDQAIQAGENPSIIDGCLITLDEENGECSWLPCVAEKTYFRYYENYKPYGNYMGREIEKRDPGKIMKEPCWIFVLSWGHLNDLGHIRFFVISAQDCSVLYAIGCQ